MNTQKLTSIALGRAAGDAVRTLHVDAHTPAVCDHVCAQIGNFETARPRDIAYFVGACIQRHAWNSARYHVALRAS